MTDFKSQYGQKQIQMFCHSTFRKRLEDWLPLTSSYTAFGDLTGKQHLAEAEREASRPIEVTQGWEPQQEVWGVHS